ncbi:MAG: hypothetical protein ABIP97_14315 [Chthoniobacterales bacterium]
MNEPVATPPVNIPAGSERRRRRTEDTLEPYESAIKVLIRRIFIYGTCFAAVALVSVMSTYEVMGPITSGPTYSINDLQGVEKSLQTYYLNVFTGGTPVYPDTLQDLVIKKYMTQPQLDQLNADYNVEYFHPPKSDISGDPILFRAQQKLPVIYYTVSGHLRMESTKE